MNNKYWGGEEEGDTNSPIEAGPTGHGPDICASHADPGL